MRKGYSAAGELARSKREVVGCGARMVGEDSDSDADSGGVVNPMDVGVLLLAVVMIVGGG
jgi:hypothetical protein